MSSDSNNPFAKPQSKAAPSRAIPQPPPIKRQPVIFEEYDEEPRSSKSPSPEEIKKAEEHYEYFRYLSLGNASLHDRYKVLKELCEITRKIPNKDKLWEHRSQVWSDSLVEYEDALIQKIREVPSVPFWNHTIGQYHFKILKTLKEIEDKSRYSDWKALYRHFYFKIVYWWVFVIFVFCTLSAVCGYGVVKHDFQKFQKTYAECQKDFQDATTSFNIEEVDGFLTKCQEVEKKANTVSFSRFMDEEKAQMDAFLAELSSFTAFAEKCKTCVQNEMEAIEGETVDPQKMMPDSAFAQMCEEGRKLGQKELINSFEKHRDEIAQLDKLEREYQSWKEQDDTDQETLERLQNAKSWVKLLSDFKSDFCEKQFQRDSERFKETIFRILERENKRFEKKIPIKSNESKYDYEDRANVNIKRFQDICDLEDTAGFSLFSEKFKKLNDTLNKAKETLAKIQE